MTRVLLTLVALLFSQTPKMSFFITSAGSGDGANLGGLAGADLRCAELAKGAGSTGLTWHAYLSVKGADGKASMNARDRIGKGPWYNQKGVMVAKDVSDLHSDHNNVNKQTALTEKGDTVHGRGDTPNMHDILTGSDLDGKLMPGDGDVTCSNWTSVDPNGSASVGHFDRQGGGTNPTSWNSAHPSRGCAQASLVATGGNGFFYCFGMP